MKDEVLKEIERQMELETDALLVLLASSGTLGASPGTPKDGDRIFRKIKDKVRERLCTDESVIAAYEGGSNSKVLLITAVVDCISGAVIGVSPVTASVLLVREGLDAFCVEVWTGEQ